MGRNVFIFHGTEGYPEENWFPWLKHELEQIGDRVFIPQFPSPPIVPSEIAKWFTVFEDYVQYVDGNTILVGHSLGGVFTLRVLEQLVHPVYAVFLVGTPVGVPPILNYERDRSFSGFDFAWEKIRAKAKKFVVFQSDDDPYVGLENGKLLAKQLGVELSFVPNAGHFNTKAGYTQFPALRDALSEIAE